MDRHNEYVWKDSEAPHTYKYLLQPIENLLDQYIKERNINNRRIRIFDAGCGNGALANWLAGQDFEIAGCDESEKGVEFARHACPKAEFKAMSVYDDMASVFGSGWDIVVSLEVIEHLYSPRVFLERVNELLIPGGLLLVSTPYHGYLKNVVLAVTGKLDNHFTALWDGGHIKFWSRKTLTQLLDNAGFDVIDFYGAGRVPWLWKSMIMTAKK